MVKRFTKMIMLYLHILGIDLLKTIYTLRGLPHFLTDYSFLKRQLKESDGSFPLGRLYPCLEDRFQKSGQATGQYFHQDLLIAQTIFKNNPHRHVDVGSRVDGFVAHVASFRSIEAIDIRPLESNVKNLTYIHMDLMKKLPEEFIESTDSVSCLHALEHFGLGRYGDPINSDGHQVGFKNLVSMLTPGGIFYLSVPIGPQRIEFNAHRVFSIAYLLQMFGDKLKIENFSYIDDKGELQKHAVLDEEAIQTNCGCVYGCGVFELNKIS